MTKLAYGYDPQEAPDKPEYYFLVAPTGSVLHYPGDEGNPICGLHSHLGWEEIDGEWEHLFRFCLRCRAQNKEIPHAGRNQYSQATHCKHGHKFSPENTRITWQGWRRCKVCEREYRKG